MAQYDIFGNRSESYPRIRGGMKFTGKAVLAFSPLGAGGATPTDFKQYSGMVIQNYNITYNQQVTKLRGLNTSDVYAVVAPPNGTMTISSTITGAADYYDFVRQYGDACFTVDNNLQMIQGGVEACGQGPTPRNTVTGFNAGQVTTGIGTLPNMTIMGALINSIQIQQAIENLVLSSTLNMDFVTLDIPNAAPNATGTGWATLPADAQATPPNFANA